MGGGKGWRLIALGLRETIVLQRQLMWTHLGETGSGFVVPYT